MVRQLHMPRSCSAEPAPLPCPALLVVLLFSAMLLSSAVAQETAIEKTRREQPSPPTDAAITEVVISPQPAPPGALDYRLLPELHELTPGNAATIYYRAALKMAALPQEHRRQFWEKQQHWLEAPLAELPEQEIRVELGRFRAVLEDLREAARREHCDWDLRIHQRRGVDVLRFSLEEFQHCRNFARLLALQARWQLAHGQHVEMIQTLQTGFSLGRHVATAPTLVNSLIGYAIVGMMQSQLLEAVQQSGFPNMYWALTALPRPLIDMRRAIEQEKNFPLQMFPVLEEAKTAQHSEDRWHEILEESIVQLAGLVEPGQAATLKNKLARTGALMLVYPAARQRLSQRGYEVKQLNSMPVPQVILVDAAESYRYAWGEVFKWAYLPYWQARVPLRETVERLKQDGYLAVGPTQQIIPLAATLLPAVEAVMQAHARSQRQLALLRCIESLRMHAAQAGELPADLSELNSAPVPPDPVRGQPFEYHIQGQTATIKALAPPGETRPDMQQHIRVRLRRPATK